MVERARIMPQHDFGKAWTSKFDSDRVCHLDNAPSIRQRIWCRRSYYSIASISNIAVTTPADIFHRFWPPCSMWDLP